MDMRLLDVLMPVYQLAQIAMCGFGGAAGCSHLDRHMMNAEIGGDAGTDGAKEHIRQRIVVSINKHMAGQHDQPWFDSPNMEVMDILHSRNRFT